MNTKWKIHTTGLLAVDRNEASEFGASISFVMFWFTNDEASVSESDDVRFGASYFSSGCVPPTRMLAILERRVPD